MYLGKSPTRELTTMQLGYLESGAGEFTVEYECSGIKEFLVRSDSLKRLFLLTLNEMGDLDILRIFIGSLLLQVFTSGGSGQVSIC